MKFSYDLIKRPGKKGKKKKKTTSAGIPQAN